MPPRLFIITNFENSFGTDKKYKRHHLYLLFFEVFTAITSGFSPPSLSSFCLLPLPSPLGPTLYKMKKIGGWDRGSAATFSTNLGHKFFRFTSSLNKKTGIHICCALLFLTANICYSPILLFD